MAEEWMFKVSLKKGPNPGERGMGKLPGPVLLKSLEIGFCGQGKQQLVILSIIEGSAEGLLSGAFYCWRNGDGLGMERSGGSFGKEGREILAQAVGYIHTGVHFFAGG